MLTHSTVKEMVMMHRILPLNVTNCQVLLALSFTTYLVINALATHLFPLLSTMKSHINLQATREIEMPSTMNQPMNMLALRMYPDCGKVYPEVTSEPL